MINEMTGILQTADGMYEVTIKVLSEMSTQPAVRRRRWTKEDRTRLLELQGHRCPLCSGPIAYFDSHFDHIVPLSAGGADEFSNLQLVHGSCNLRKGSKVTRILDEGRMPWAH